MAYIVVANGTGPVHEFNWAPRAPIAATISTSVWTVSPASEGIATASPTIASMLTRAKIVATLPHKVATVTNYVTFSDGTDDKQAITVRTADTAEVA